MTPEERSVPSQAVVQARCPSCGQVLVTPVQDLRRKFKCPRCTALFVPADVVDHATPLPAIAAEEEPAVTRGNTARLPVHSPGPTSGPGSTVPLPVYSPPVSGRGSTQPLPLPNLPLDATGPSQPAPSADPEWVLPPRSLLEGTTPPAEGDGHFEHPPSVPTASDTLDDTGAPGTSVGGTTQPLPLPAPAPPSPPAASAAAGAVRHTRTQEDIENDEARARVAAMRSPRPAPRGEAGYPNGAPPQASAAPPGVDGSWAAPPARASVPDLRERAAAGLTQTGRIAQRMLDMASRLDERVAGHRGAWIATVAILTGVGGPLLDFLFDTLLWTPIGAVTLVGVLDVFLLARIGSLRDDRGQWQAGVVARRAWAGVELMWLQVTDFFTASSAERLRTTGWLSLIAGVCLLACRTVVATVDSALGLGLAEWIDRLLVLGVVGLAIGGSILFRARRLRKHTAKREGLTIEPAALPELERSITALPPVLDLTTGDLPSLRGAHAHPLFQSVMPRLATWRPSRWFPYEDQYQNSLFRHLRKVVPELDVKREVRLRSSDFAERGRVDFVLADCIAMEMKHKLSTSASNTALGQIQIYRQLWRHGPVILLLCGEAPGRFYGSILEQQVLEMHRRGEPVLVVIAGVQ
jgi:hypothetical protein